MARRRPDQLVPLLRWLRWRRHRPAAWVAAVVVLVLLIWTDRAGLFLYDGGDLHIYDGQTVLVDRIIDGDTLDVRHPDGNRPTTRIRLWGMDTPERARPSERKPAQPYAEEASQRAAALCHHQPVTLRLEPHRLRDRYNRVLAFVEMPDGTLLNEALLIEGLARADARWSHRHIERFDLLERQAKSDKRGLWAAQATAKARDDP